MQSLKARRTPPSARTTRIPRARTVLDGDEMTRAEQAAAGKKLRERCPRTSQATWKRPANRLDAVELVLAAEKGRRPELLPLRHGRMVRSAFTFYRGAALPDFRVVFPSVTGIARAPPGGGQQ